MVVSLLKAIDFLVARSCRSGGEMTVFRYVLNNTIGLLVVTVTAIFILGNFFFLMIHE